VHECFNENVHLPTLPLGWRFEVKEVEDAVDGLIYAASEGIKRKDFIEMYGYNAYEAVLDNWLADEVEGYLRPNQTSQTVLEIIQETIKTQ
jgi:hypothetical protein